MAATYEPIATTTLASAQATITFSSIPATYTDLKLVLNCSVSSTAADRPQVIFNSDTGTNYSQTRLYGDGTAAASNRGTTIASLVLGSINTTQPEFVTMDIFSYAGSTYKTTLMTFNSDDNGGSRGSTWTSVGLWRSTAAITRLDFTFYSGASFAIGTTATIYGIKAA